MKNAILLTLTFLFVAQLSIGQNFLEDNYQTYMDDDNVTYVFVSGKTFNYASYFIPEEEEKGKEIKDFVSKITAFHLIKVDKSQNAREDFPSAVDQLSRDNKFEELIRVRDKEANFALFIDETADIVHELVGVGFVEEEFIAFTLVGEMDLNKIAELTKMIQSKEFTPLKTELKTIANADIKVYPNPLTSNGTMNIEVTEALIGGQGTLYDVNGKRVSTFEIQNETETIETGNWNPGNYIIELRNQDLVVKKKVILIR